MTDQSPAPADNQTQAENHSAIAPEVPPMTATLMGRLFVVPALVVVSLLAVAVVVISFGASPIEKPNSVDELLRMIESDSGDRSLGNMVLSPKSKQTWQAAQELAIRFEKGRFGDEPIEPMAQRLISLIRKRRDAAASDKISAEDRESGVALQQFLILALAKLKTTSGLQATIEWLGDSDPQIRRIALQGIADMREMPEAKTALKAMYPLLEDDTPEVRIVAALAIAAVAPKGDKAAIQHIEAMAWTDRDTQMNRATALAKLGSVGGRIMMLNMLDRGYWRNLSPPTDESASAWRPLSEDEISARLIALAPIAATLNDAAIIEAITHLSKDDPSPQVRDAAIEALALRTAGTASDTDSDVGAHAGLRSETSAAHGA
ncbi:MAG TPA: HEAT repeat domain-containing protein [Phycisphaerae bacterium]|nr:HEAT repeat domain-containing protein [Phycisphaerae bacterium]HRW55604.1 HEAT repeat domain-containing protein [Phycisphaerae bacterium]